MAGAQGPLLVCTGDLLGSADAYSPGPGTYERAGNIYASLVGSLVRHDPPAPGAERRRRKRGGAGGAADDDDEEDPDEEEDDALRQRGPTKPVLAVTSARALARQAAAEPSAAAAAKKPKMQQPQDQDDDEDDESAAASSAASPAAFVVPKPGDVVTGRVTRVGPGTAQVALLCSGRRALPTFPGAAAFASPSAAAAGCFRGVVRKQDVRRTDVDGVVMRECFRPGDVVRCAVLSLGDSRAYFLSTAANELGVVAARSAATGAAMVPVSWQEMACPLTGTVERRKVARVGAPGGGGG